MERQISFSELEFRSKRKRTQKEVFFERMEKLVPLREWCEIILPYYYEDGNGRPPVRLEIMVKMYLVSQWYNLSDPQTEDMLNENLAARGYVGISGNAPDETTLCKFRGLLEKNGLNKAIFESFNTRLVEKKIMIREGTIVDATIIDAPESRKNKHSQKTPEMASTRKSNSHRYGMKAHIGVDSETGLVHSMAATAANVTDVEMAGAVVHGEESKVHGDAGFTGIERRVEIREKFQDGSGETEWLTNNHKNPPHLVCKLKEGVEFTINKKRGSVTTEEEKEQEKAKSRVRIKVEWAFAVIKHRFGFRKTRYRNLAKNENKLYMLFTLANVFRCSQMKLSTI